MRFLIILLANGANVNKKTTLNAPFLLEIPLHAILPNALNRRIIILIVYPAGYDTALGTRHLIIATFTASLMTRHETIA